MVLLAAAQAYITLQSIPVQRIGVTGELEYTQTAVVQELVQPELAGGFLKADLQRIRTQLEGLPWIYEATVRRKWPNALEINVVEQLPIARWGDDGFLNHEGEVFHSGKAGQWQSLPQLQGPEGTARALMDNYQRLLEILAPLGLTLEQPIFQYRVRNLGKASRSNLESSYQQFYFSMSETVFRVSKLYFLILSGVKTVSIMEESEKDIGKHRDLIYERYNVGELPETAYLEAEYEFEKSELEVLKAKNMLKKINKIIDGQEKAKLIIEDPSGNSAIISEKAEKSKLKVK